MLILPNLPPFPPPALASSSQLALLERVGRHAKAYICTLAGTVQVSSESRGNSSQKRAAIPGARQLPAPVQKAQHMNNKH